MPRLLLYRQLITLLWLAWALYWIVSAANSKTTGAASRSARASRTSCR